MSINDTEYRVGMRVIKDPIPITGPEDVFSLLSELRSAEVEIPVGVHVTSGMKAVAVETCAIGSMMSVSVEARTIFANAIHAKDDRSIILVHNHAFQKKVTPSDGDKEFFQNIKTGGRIVGVHLHDSVIIGMDGYFSFMEHGISLKKDVKYSPHFPSPQMDAPFYKVSASHHQRVSNARKAFEAASFLRFEKIPMFGILHMTPDLEPTSVDVVWPSKIGNPASDASRILREVLLSKSTKYFIFFSNLYAFERKHKADQMIRELIGDIRLGSIVLCVPLIDVIMLNEKGDYHSFSEHGEVFPKMKSYVLMEDEGMKLKGPKKTGRADLPPYSWTFR